MLDREVAVPRQCAPFDCEYSQCPALDFVVGLISSDYDNDIQGSLEAVFHFNTAYGIYNYRIHIESPPPPRILLGDKPLFSVWFHTYINNVTHTKIFDLCDQGICLHCKVKLTRTATFASTSARSCSRIRSPSAS